MDVVIRVLIGIVLLFVFGWLWTFLFGLLVAVVNLPAFGLGRLLRRIFGVRGQWDAGLAASGAVAGLAKTGVTLAFWLSLVWYAFLYPIGDVVAEGAAAFAIGVTLAIWMPATFFLALFQGDVQ